MIEGPHETLATTDARELLAVLQSTRTQVGQGVAQNNIPIWEFAARGGGTETWYFKPLPHGFEVWYTRP